MNPAGLENLGLDNIGKVFYNLGFDELIDHELKNNECKMTTSGSTTVDTGIFTGRSPKDKYFVDQEESNKYISWGNVNHLQYWPFQNHKNPAVYRFEYWLSNYIWPSLLCTQK